MENVKWISGKGHDFILPYRVRKNRKDREATGEWNSLRKYRAAKRKGGTSFNPISRLEFRIINVPPEREPPRNGASLFINVEIDRFRSSNNGAQNRIQKEIRSTDFYRKARRFFIVLFTLLYTRFVKNLEKEIRKGKATRGRVSDDERMREVTGDG